MAKRKGEEPKGGAPEWMATFSDLMNLLLCFFVMLFAMSNMDEQKLHELVAAMNNTVSIFDAGSTAIGDGILISNGMSQLNELDQYINSTGKSAESETQSENMEKYEDIPDNVTAEQLQEALEAIQTQDNEEKAEEVDEALEESGVGDQVDVSFTAQYVQLTMNGALLFESGSAQLKDDAKTVLDRVGVVLEHYSRGTVEIEGHTDNVPIRNALYPSNEELSSARALSVYYYLVDTTYLDPALLQHAGKGDRCPVASNDTPEGRRMNRRVEIRIYNPS